MAFVTSTTLCKATHLSKMVHSFSCSLVKSQSASTLTPQICKSSTKLIQTSSISNIYPTLQINKNDNVASFHPVIQISPATKSIISSRKLFSTGIFDRMRGAFSDKADKKKEEQMTEQLRKMSEYEEWNLGTYANDLKTTMSDWKTKIPGMGYTDEVKKLKSAKKILDSVLSHVGDKATSDTLNQLTRKDKLKIAINGDVNVDDIDIMIGQFNNMNMMHKVLRYRKKHGKSIPTDEASMTLAVQKDAVKVMSKEEKSQMQKSMQAKARRSFR